jgi:hypothetical protein
VAFPGRARSAGVTVAGRRRAMPGVANGRQLPCAEGAKAKLPARSSESPAGASRPPRRARPPSPGPLGHAPRAGCAPSGARRAPRALEDVRDIHHRFPAARGCRKQGIEGQRGPSWRHLGQHGRGRKGRKRLHSASEPDPGHRALDPAKRITSGAARCPTPTDGSPHWLH